MKRIELGCLCAEAYNGRLTQWQRWEQMIPLVRRILDGEEGEDAGDD